MTTDTPKAATISVDASQWLGKLAHNWTYIGYDEINYTYVPEGQELLAKFMQFGEQPYFVRTHHLFCTGNCHASYKWGSTNVYLEDDVGQPMYDWTFVDLTFDTLRRYGCKPFVELGFMPQDLVDSARYRTDRGDTYRTYGWACPPKDYDKWYDLVFHLVRHCAERYGEEEIASWYWELWNEPDLDYYWKGTVEEFNQLYDCTAAAVKAACPQARIGGPATTNPAPGSRAATFLDAFLDHCANGTNYHSGQQGTTLDFVTFHVKGGGYRADPKHHKQPPPSVRQILSHTQNGYAIISNYPQFKALECILSEIDPDGWAAGGAWDNRNLNFRNTEYYPSFVATAFDKVSRFARREGWDLRLLSWAFLFVGERCFEGTRTFSTQGIDKAILNLFRMYAHTGTTEVAFTSSNAQNPLDYADLWGTGVEPDIAGFAALNGNQSLTVLIYNHHDDWDRREDYTIELEIANLPFDSADLVVQHYRIDHAHSNAYGEWLRQDQPMYPAPGQRAAINARAGLELLEPPRQLASTGGKVSLSFAMPVHSVSLIVLQATTRISQ